MDNFLAWDVLTLDPTCEQRLTRVVCKKKKDEKRKRSSGIEKAAKKVTF